MYWVFCTLEDLVKLCITHVQERPEHWWPEERERAAHPRASLRLPRVVHTREHRDGARFRMEADCVTGGVCARMSFLGISAAGWRPGPRHNPVQRVLPSAMLGGRDWSCVNAHFFWEPSVHEEARQDMRSCVRSLFLSVGTVSCPSCDDAVVSRCQDACFSAVMDVCLFFLPSSSSLSFPFVSACVGRASKGRADGVCYRAAI